MNANKYKGRNRHSSEQHPYSTPILSELLCLKFPRRAQRLLPQSVRVAVSERHSSRMTRIMASPRSHPKLQRVCSFLCLSRRPVTRNDTVKGNEPSARAQRHLRREANRFGQRPSTDAAVHSASLGPNEANGEDHKVEMEKMEKVITRLKGRVKDLRRDVVSLQDQLREVGEEKDALAAQVPLLEARLASEVQRGMDHWESWLEARNEAERLWVALETGEGLGGYGQALELRP